MQVRPASLADIPWLIEAGEQARQEAPTYGSLTAHPGDQYKRLVLILRRPDLVFVGVCDDATGFVIGALEPTVWFDEVVAVQNLLWVTPAKRGTARAWRLVAAFEQWAIGTEATRVVSGVSSGLDIGVFYERLGYTPMGMSYYKELK